MDNSRSCESLFHSVFKDVLLEGYVGEGVLVVHLHAPLGKECSKLFAPFFRIVEHIVHPAEYTALNVVDEFFLGVILEF